MVAWVHPSIAWPDVNRQSLIIITDDSSDYSIESVQYSTALTQCCTVLYCSATEQGPISISVTLCCNCPGGKIGLKLALNWPDGRPIYRSNFLVTDQLAAVVI